MAENTSTAAGRSEWSWYHITLTTSGAWLHGDPRVCVARSTAGTRVAPPIRWVSAPHRRVQLPQAMRAVVGQALREQFEDLGAIVGMVSVGRRHAHIVVCMPRGLARKWASLAKRYAFGAAIESGWAQRLWGKRSKAAPVRRASRLLGKYLLRNEQPGTWRWSAA